VKQVALSPSQVPSMVCFKCTTEVHFTHTPSLSSTLAPASAVVVFQVASQHQVE